MWGRRGSEYPTGYGEKDEELAHRLFNAISKREAQQIAREDGHDSVEDAVQWLVDRSAGGWVG